MAEKPVILVTGDREFQLVVKYLEDYWLLIRIHGTQMEFHNVGKPDKQRYHISPKHKFITDYGVLCDGSASAVSRHTSITPMEWVTSSIDRRAWMFIDPFSKRDKHGTWDTTESIIMPVDCPWTKEV